jgi:hypothetical protein
VRGGAITVCSHVIDADTLSRRAICIWGRACKAVHCRTHFLHNSFFTRHQSILVACISGFATSCHPSTRKLKHVTGDVACHCKVLNLMAHT